MRVRRRKEIIYEGITQSLRRFQDEVNEVRAGMECGIRIDGFSEVQVGDQIECYCDREGGSETVKGEPAFAARHGQRLSH